MLVSMGWHVTSLAPLMATAPCSSGSAGAEQPCDPVPARKLACHVQGPALPCWWKGGLAVHPSAVACRAPAGLDPLYPLQYFGDVVMRPFLQDTIQWLPLTVSMVGMLVKDPVPVVRSVFQVSCKQWQL